MSFYKLGIKNDLVYALEKQNILVPTPIQNMSIPTILSGEDIIAQAQTGTGKTLAFLLPIFQNIDLENNNIQGLILTPTRELAIQITAVAKKLAKEKSIKILAAYGGQDVKAQLHKLNGSVHLVIGTPGRILDHIRRGSVNFDDLKTFVVDEADQLFHIGFKVEVNNIIKTLPAKRQTLCFSATISDSMNSFTKRHLTNPRTIKVAKKQVTLENIVQFVVESSNRRKFDDFVKIIKQNYPEKAIIFCRTRMGTHKLYQDMTDAGFNVGSLHGALTQAKRESVMEEFRDNKTKFLVATDVASRGLDVTGVSHVFNYNLPDDPESYVHRIGRTGRAGYSGVAYTILTNKDLKRLESIESFIGMKIDRIKELPKKEIKSNNPSPAKNYYKKKNRRKKEKKRFQ